LVVVSMLAMGLAGGAIFALAGPKNNPLRTWAEEQGLVGRRAAPPDPTAQHLDSARRAQELDTLPMLEQAAAELNQALALRPDDPQLMAELALVLTTHADALRRGAADDEARAAKMEAEKPGTGAALLKQATEARTRASALIKSAFDTGRKAYEMQPAALASTRALADYYRVQRDTNGRVAQMLGLARTAAQAAATTDAATLYIEAADLCRDLGAAAPADLERATRLLEEALTVRPTLVRARVLLSRILASRGHSSLAAAELRRALEAAPDHAEAKRLLEAVTAPVAAAPPKPVPPKAEPPKAEPPKAEPKAAPSGGETAEEENKPKVSFDSYVKQADRLREKGEAWEALLQYEKAAGLRPSSGRAYSGMGWSYLDLSKPEAALHQFRKAIAVDPSHAEGHLGHADAYRALGNSDKALASYKKYLELKPSGVGAEAARRAIAALEGGGEASAAGGSE
jgi:tetratricopeptide (TPR) repeat protein